MVKVQYADAYKEVLCVINNLVKEDYDKIPKDYIDFFETNCNKDYEFHYDKTKPFKDQVLLDDTKYILFKLFEEFGTTQKQKEKINAFRTNYYNLLEEEKRQKYNPEDLFEKNTPKQESATENLPVEYQKQNSLKKFLNFIRSFLKR